MQEKQIDPNTPAKRSVGSVLGFSLLATLLSLVNVLWLPTSLVLPLPVMLTGVLMVVFWQKAGPVPACLLAAGSALSAALYGLLPALMVVLSQVLPAVFVLRGMNRKLPFMPQLIFGAAAYLIGMALTVLATIALYGRDPIGSALNALQPIIEADLPNVYATSGRNMAQLYNVTITYEEFEAAFRSGLSVIELYFRRFLLANLITGAAFSGALSVFWGNWVQAKQGRASRESFLGLADWRLPDNWVLGLNIMLLAGWLLSAAELNGLDKANAIVRGLARLSFVVVALAAMDKKGRESGQPVSRRRLRVVLMTIAGFLTSASALGFGVFEALAVFGDGLALFGENGALRPWLEKMKNGE